VHSVSPLQMYKRGAITSGPRASASKARSTAPARAIAFTSATPTDTPSN
jgi:hypothetical protein